MTYYDLRAEYGLMAQHAIRAIGVVVDAYKADRHARRIFRPEGAVVLDSRLYGLKGNHAYVTTLNGRVKIKLNIGGIQRTQLGTATKMLEANLVCDRKGRWRLMVSAHYPDPEPVAPQE